MILPVALRFALVSVDATRHAFVAILSPAESGFAVGLRNAIFFSFFISYDRQIMHVKVTNYPGIPVHAVI